VILILHGFQPTRTVCCTARVDSATSQQSAAALFGQWYDNTRNVTWHPAEMSTAMWRLDGSRRCRSRRVTFDELLVCDCTTNSAVVTIMSSYSPICCDCGSILYGFRDKARYWSKIATVSYLVWGKTIANIFTPFLSQPSQIPANRFWKSPLFMHNTGVL